MKRVVMRRIGNERIEIWNKVYWRYTGIRNLPGKDYEVMID